ncbi:hypothetical protein GOODEAATRI_014516 [Goodea atripinnis]|uniref:Uncharacterized protein n=1 Tax=Goodea atripinnis TaxID=208336 RepID=A0ABV0PNJ7_9TELE
MEATERLRVTKTSLEVSNEKLESELENTKERLRTALSKAVAVGSDSKASKATVVTRMFENKMKELERELSQKTSSVSELKQQLKEAKEREERAHTWARQLEDQVRANRTESGTGQLIVEWYECIKPSLTAGGLDDS